MMRVLCPGECEPMKLSFHALSGMLCAVFTIYNVMAFLARHERHNAVNACIYALGTAGEVYQTSCHFHKNVHRGDV